MLREAHNAKIAVELEHANHNILGRAASVAPEKRPGQAIRKLNRAYNF